ncbi:MAG: 30S ribosomal protein S4 [Candidatus Nanohalarchaeota archaeon]|nr:MAG: 30S ribosomal protein S4 [Candidatus Nanohaloarchaeota archaeon]
MGDPRKLKNHFSSVRRPYDVSMLEEERNLKEKYGIRRKKEIRKIEYLWKSLRQRARKLIAEKDKGKMDLLFKKVDSYGLCQGEPTFENVLALKLTDVLDRRLQNVMCKLNLANTPMQARQYIVHRHVKINGIVIFSPNHIVKKEEENNIVVNPKISRQDSAAKREKKEDKSEAEPIKKEEEIQESAKEEKLDEKKEDATDEKKEDKSEAEPIKKEEEIQESAKEEKLDEKKEEAK